MTLRSEGQFNTVVYEDEDIYRGNERRDVVMMNEADAASLNLRRDQRVVVYNETGRWEVVVRFAPLPRGNLVQKAREPRGHPAVIHCGRRRHRCSVANAWQPNFFASFCAFFKSVSTIAVSLLCGS